MINIAKLIHQKKVIYSAVVIVNILIASFVIYIIFFKGKEKPLETGALVNNEITGETAALGEAKPETKKSVSKKGVAASSTSLFDDPLFNSLKAHGDLPIKIGIVGRKSPFDLFSIDIPTTTEITTGQQE